MADTAACAFGVDTGFSDKVRPNKATISTETRRRGSAKPGSVVDMVERQSFERLRKMTCRVRAESARPRVAASPQGTPWCPVLHRSSVSVTVGKSSLPSARVTEFGDRADRPG